MSRETRWLRVRNWQKFQHYGDRSPPWIKLYVELLADYEFTRLSEVNRLHLVLIWLVASRYDGAVPHDAEWLGRQISAASPVDLDALIRAGFLEPGPRYHGASNPLDQSKRREETDTSAPMRAREEVEEQRVREAIPEEYHSDLDAHLRASHRPFALIMELRKILDGEHHGCRGATPDDVGTALRDTSLTPGPLTGGKLAGFVRGAKSRREEPKLPRTGLGRPKTITDEFREAIAEAEAREQNHAR